MKQIRTILAAISLYLFLSVPILAFAASESEPGQEAEKKQEAGADREAEEKQEAGTGQEEKPRQATELEKEETIPQTDREDFGILRMQNAAAGCGEQLSGAVFAVYKKGGTKTGELTLMKGAASLSLPLGEYYLKQIKAPVGYGVEPARIAFTIARGETTLVEVTSETDLTNVDPQDIIPKTGQAPPIRKYLLSVCCFIIAFLCGFRLWRMDSGNGRKGGARLWQS